MSSSKLPAALASMGALLLIAACRPASAQYATLALQSQPGDFIGLGDDYSIVYTPATITNGFFSAQVINTEANGKPGEIEFNLGNAVVFPNDTIVSLDFGTNQLIIPLQPGTYTNAQRANFAKPGHAGLDVGFQGRGCNTLTGSFMVTDFTYTGTTPDSFVIDRFDATFEQHCEGAAPSLFGQFSYRATGAPPVPEASSTVSLGLLLALGLGGLVTAAMWKKKAASSL